MKTEKDYEKKFRHLYHETGKLSDALEEALGRQETVITCLHNALRRATTEQAFLTQLIQQAYDALTEADDL